MLYIMKKEKLFTIIYADIFIFCKFLSIFAHLCQVLPIYAKFLQCQCSLKWKKMGAIRQHWLRDRVRGRLQDRVRGRLQDLDFVVDSKIDFVEDFKIDL